MSIEKVINTINKYDRFLISSHINLEGDALGSELAIASLLKKLDKKVCVVNSDKVPSVYKFLPDVKSIIHKIEQDFNFEVVIFVDCSGIDRIGDIIVEHIPDNILTVNIDHHISNAYFAKINWVDTRSSCAGEMVYRLFKQMDIKLSNSDAILLYVAMLTDTGSFRYPNTTRFTHEAVADLLRFNIPISRIYRRMYESNRFSDIIFFNKILSTLQKRRGGKVAWMEIVSTASNKRSECDQSENLLNFARSIRGVEVVLLFRQVENKNETRVNLRSQGKIDVNRVASFFGGGGHKTASGCTIKENLDRAKELVFDKIDKEL